VQVVVEERGGRSRTQNPATWQNARQVQQQLWVVVVRGKGGGVCPTASNGRQRWCGAVLTVVVCRQCGSGGRWTAGRQ